MKDGEALYRLTEFDDGSSAWIRIWSGNGDPQPPSVLPGKPGDRRLQEAALAGATREQLQLIRNELAKLDA